MGDELLNKGWRDMAIVLGAAFAFVALIYLIALSAILGGAYRLLIAAPIRKLGWHLRYLALGPGDQLCFQRSIVAPTAPQERE